MLNYRAELRQGCVVPLGFIALISASNSLSQVLDCSCQTSSTGKCELRVRRRFCLSILRVTHVANHTRSSDSVVIVVPVTARDTSHEQ